MGFVADFISFQVCKHFENRLRFDEVTESLKVGTFLKHSVFTLLKVICFIDYCKIAVTITFHSYILHTCNSQVIPWLHVKQNYFKIISAFVDVQLK